MTRILKYQLRDRPQQFFALPENSSILSVQEQDGEITLWAAVPNKPDASFIISSLYTGENHNPSEDGDYLSTIQRSDGIVLHLFIKPYQGEILRIFHRTGEIA